MTATMRFVAKMSLAITALIALPSAVDAGPPFLTDDPEPVKPDGWELDVASLDQRTNDGRSGTAPHVEVNYGVHPDVQLHLIAPMAFSQQRRQQVRYGYGDTELGVKYRFMHESDDRPQVAVFPLVEVPTGNRGDGLGSGHTQIFLPVWIQKSSGSWTTYGGGGYWINPGAGNRNYWFLGWELQRQVAPWLMLGGELFHMTPVAVGARSQSGFNLGGVADVNDHVHVLASAGRQLTGSPLSMGYAGLQLTW